MDSATAWCGHYGPLAELPPLGLRLMMDRARAATAKNIQPRREVFMNGRIVFTSLALWAWFFISWSSFNIFSWPFVIAGTMLVLQPVHS